MLGEHGLAWPWESLHIEALAWFDHWLKGRDTGILDGPKFRYVLPGAEGWHTAESWPPAGVTQRALALRADGSLADAEGAAGSRTLMVLGAGLGRVQASETDPPSHLTWTGALLDHDLDVVGDIELQLEAVSTASDTAWIVLLQDVDAVGTVTNVTAGYLRASMREVDEPNSRIGAPEIPCRTFQAVPIGELVAYRIRLVANARRFKAGHCMRLLVTSDDQDPDSPVMMGFRHASVGTSCLNEIKSSSRLILPVLTPRR
jgi:uncharacterized protein